MRSAFDRLRHAISFEVIALILVIPAGAILFDVPLHDFGVVGIVSATLATLWNREAIAVNQDKHGVQGILRYNDSCSRC